tara:strand:+ start:3721 stop:4314 length:594 start_codon:yes stop_codon:yes gene_type:complete
MDKIREILIGTNNIGKYQEICDLLPAEIKKYTPKKFKLPEPYEGGKTFEENSIIKASYYSKKTNLICLSDDSGLEVDVLNGNPGIHSARWGGENKNFSQAIEKVLNEIKKIKNPPKENFARFICCLTLFWPNGKSYTSKGVVEGKISMKKKGDNGFGYDPIFIPDGYNKTFGEMDTKLKISIDHRANAFAQIKNFFN